MVPDPAASGLTIVVLTHNRRRALGNCLESLFAQEDPGTPLHFIVVDDGSTDGTGEMVRALTASRPQWRCISQAHRGIAAARNTGIRSSRSAWIAIVADDYILPANYARTITGFFNEHPQAEVLRFRVVPAGKGFLNLALHAYREAGVSRRVRSRNDESLTIHHTLEAAGAAAFRKRVFQRVGDFDESFVRGEDTEFTVRLRHAGIAVHLLPQLPISHFHESNLGAALKNAFRGGRASWRLHVAPNQEPPGILALVQLALHSGLAAFYWACWRAGKAGGPVRSITYWPVLFLLETSARAGFFSAGVQSRKKTQAASLGPTPR
ncbi:MAG TPA: glycosyltransferase [Candidatus Binatia bacterium]|nr:glycosyltransferase [Candidatus Binatia bacterium]